MSTQSKFQKVDAAIVPIEGPAETSAERSVSAGLRRESSKQGKSEDTTAFERGEAGKRSPYGPNNENLPERLQEALKRLVLQFSTESELSRRQEIRRIKQAHQFWRGLQYLWWDERDQNWHLPFEQKLTDASSVEDLPRYEFVTNIYQAFGLSLIAVLSQDVPRVRFFPSSAQAEEDVAAAKAATEVAALVERNNRIGNLIVDEAFNLWTDGKVGAYVRFVVDGQRFGFHPETEVGEREVRVGGDCYVCPECGAETDRKNAQLAARGEDETGGGNSAEMALSGSSSEGKQQPSGDLREARCAECGAVLSEEDFVAAEAIAVPEAQTRLRVPNGQEVVTIVGGLGVCPRFSI